MSRTKRKPYTGSKRLDRSCRNSGTCQNIRANRLPPTRKRVEERAKGERDEPES